MRGANSTYWGDILEGLKSIKLGLIVSWRHFYLAVFKGKRQRNSDISSSDYFQENEGIFTVEYPKVSMPVPDNGRYRLHNEIDDCIVCDKCVKICPVDCIEIETIKSASEIRKTSDGSSVRLYAATFNIDMAKCCYCGLCTTVCPTECLTMTKTYDFSEIDITKMVYEFSDLTAEQAQEKREEYEKNQLEKQQKVIAKPQVLNEKEGDDMPIAEKKPVITGAKPVFKPKIPIKKKPDTEENKHD